MQIQIKIVENENIGENRQSEARVFQPLFWDNVSCAVLAGLLEVIEIHLLLPPKCWGKSMCHHAWHS